jgi:hypothetical protein
MAIVQANKRGHHAEFALSREEVEDLISSSSNRKSKAMIVLASLGVPVRGIVIFKAKDHTFVENGDYTLDITGVTGRPIQLSPKQWQFLTLFREGFGCTDVTVWRRIKREVLAAGKAGIINFDPEHVPFPASLAYQAAEQPLSSHQVVKWALGRVHALQGRIPNNDFGTVEDCSHKDCAKLRAWLSRKKEDTP